VRTLIKSKLQPGDHRISWDGGDNDGQPLPSGVYFMVLRAGNAKLARKAVMVK
jgi:flagellar hook assembly protein FlgD